MFFLVNYGQQKAESCFVKKILFLVFVSLFFRNVGQLMVDFKTCKWRAVSSETDVQLQAAKLSNYTNSAATFASY